MQYPIAMRQPKVIDVFPYLDEEGPLLARFLQLKDHVDLFVAVEGNLTHSGLEKEFTFEDTALRLGLPRNKVVALKIDLAPNLTPFERDSQQRDYAKEYLLENFTPDDVLIFGDVDEVPSSSGIIRALEAIKNGAHFAHLAMDMTVGYMNNVEVSHRLLSFMGEYPNIHRSDRRWLGTSVCTFDQLKKISLSELRHPARKIGGLRISEAGWHFSYCGGGLQLPSIQRIMHKLLNSAHVEFSAMQESKVRNRLAKGRDILGRRFVRFKFIDSERFLPTEIRSHPLLSQLIYKK